MINFVGTFIPSLPYYFVLPAYIGTNVAGTQAIANGNGVLIENSVGNLIGTDTIDEERNIISGNNEIGIVLRMIPNINIANYIRGNYI